MAISFSEKRTAVRPLSRFDRVLCLLVPCVMAILPASAQERSMFSSIVEANANGMSGYVFVSPSMPDASLIALARDARKAGMTLVLNGFFEDGRAGLDATRRKISAINSACCANAGAHWQVNPLLYQRYGIKATPAFVIAKGTGTGSSDFSKVAGDMSVANALKFFGQESRVPDIRDKARDIYTRAFSTQ